MSFIPLYELIKQRIRDDILDAQDNGARLPTERELQARYQVSRPTISKALTLLAGEGLLVKSQGRGSFVRVPSSIGNTPSSNLPRRIGYVAPIFGEELVQRAFRGIDRTARRHDFRVLMGSSGNNLECEHAAAQELIASGARGLIVYPVPRFDRDEGADYLPDDNLGVPIILIDTCLPSHGHIQVVFDNHRAGYATTSWLIGQRHHSIGFLLWQASMHHRPLAERLKGYREALNDRDIPFNPALVRHYSPVSDTNDLEDVLAEWLEMPNPPTAIITPEDTSAIEVIDRLMLHRVRVPEDIRVVGFDNREAARRFKPSFTTTNPNFEHMGEIACRLLVDAIELGDLPPRTYMLDVPLLVRRASDAALALV